MDRRLEAVLTPDQALWVADRITEAILDGEHCPFTEVHAQRLHFQATAEVADEKDW